MKRIICLLILTLAGCGGGQPTMAPHQAPPPTATEDLPPAEPIVGVVPPHGNTRGNTNTDPPPGIYHFVEIEPTNLWIIGEPVRVPRDSIGADIQLDGLDIPERDAANDPSPELLETVCAAVRTAFVESKDFRFVPTQWGYAPGGEIGGVIYLENGHTLQDVLLSKGLARVKRQTRDRYFEATLAPALLEYWQRCEDKARAARVGFWRNHPDLMKRPWDDKDEKNEKANQAAG